MLTSTHQKIFLQQQILTLAHQTTFHQQLILTSAHQKIFLQQQILTSAHQITHYQHRRLSLSWTFTLISVYSTVADVSSEPTLFSTAQHSTPDENHKQCCRNGGYVGRHSTAQPFEWKWFWNGKNPAELRSLWVIYALSIKCSDCLMVWTRHQISWGLPHQRGWHGWSFATGGEKRVCWRNLKETDNFELHVCHPDVFV